MAQAVKEKHSKSEANYRLSRSPSQRCGVCKHFMRGLPRDDNSCSVVAGKIDAYGVSDYFERRGG